MSRPSIEENGFAVIPSVVSEESISILSEEFAHADLRRSRAGVRHALGNPAVTKLARDSRLLRIAAESLENEAFPFRATLFDKSPVSNWLVVWHQDTALPLQKKQETPGWGPWSVKDGVIYAHAPSAALSQVVALRIHLDDSTEQNGPLRVLSGTHKLGVLADDAIHDLSIKIPPIDCLVPKGGVVAMKPLIVHASSKSRSEESRRVLHIEYAASNIMLDGLELAIA
jgi:ectoine hydroxylase-related dioxygenase (phytanoyl-CoA dioxygenase family)